MRARWPWGVSLWTPAPGKSSAEAGMPPMPPRMCVPPCSCARHIQCLPFRLPAAALNLSSPGPCHGTVGVQATRHAEFMAVDEILGWGLGEAVFQHCDLYAPSSRFETAFKLSVFVSVCRGGCDVRVSKCVVLSPLLCTAAQVCHGGTMHHVCCSHGAAR